jgi:nucleotide-binding universal stress UspA family protein
MKTLLVSVDFSAATRAVIDTALELAAPAGAKLILHHTLVPALVTTEYGLGVEMLREAELMSEKAARHQLEHLEDELTARGADAATVLTHGSAAPCILEAAKKHRADLIVLGSHGHTAFYDLIVGSTTHAVLKKAACPVLVVPPAAAEKAPSARRKRK